MSDVLKTLKEELSKGLTVKVGILGSTDARPDGTSNLEIGAKHELGLEGMKQRSFLRLTYMLKSEDFKKYLEKNREKFLALILGSGIEAALAEMGRFWVEEVQNTFEAEGYGNWPAISQAWAEEKGFDTILTHTGELKRSITYEVS